ncbi:MAG: hypothetical protein AW10_03427 [Candidatus Accumulibacter appositus]|uniref:TMEM205-like domain-containing protein n=1 Tax=Candidatus Accumulibacter appositus TaxID=1454003 RepID=A0A011PM72_9PROT|nr:DUF4149 domain-containing protein [Accumulibacter sp.]EXI77940.1 MAG: hypothetical protein AW10_03427 [Candidatus Accumulibacter appositus]HRF03762.1 DUF4149 domain-containing protein [Accumulibacter sp.]
MRRLADALYEITLTLWVGGLWAIGFLVAPLLFSVLAADRQLAGLIAGKLFALIGWVGLGCATYLLLHTVVRMGRIAWRRWTFWLLLTMLLLTAVNLFGIQPLLAQIKADTLPRQAMESVLNQRFAIWHGVSGVVYVVQSLLGVLLVIGFRRAAR